MSKIENLFAMEECCVDRCIAAIESLLDNANSAAYELYLRDHSPERLHQAFERVLAA
jgi:hypothetical protein